MTSSKDEELTHCCEVARRYGDATGLASGIRQERAAARAQVIAEIKSVLPGPYTTLPELLAELAELRGAYERIQLERDGELL